VPLSQHKKAVFQHNPVYLMYTFCFIRTQFINLNISPQQIKSAVKIAPTATAKPRISHLKNYHIRFFRLRLCASCYTGRSDFRPLSIIYLKLIQYKIIIFYIFALCI